MRVLRCYELTLPVKAPFHFPSLEFGHFGYDGVGHQDADGYPLVPREQIKGLLRHGLSALSQVGSDTAKQLLGAFGSEGPNVAPVPRSEAKASDASEDYAARTSGLVSVTDAIGDQKSSADLPASPRVAIGDVTGAAAPGQLQVIEQLALPGAVVLFRSKFYVYQDDGADYCDVLKSALEYHGAIGSQKSVGFGELAHVKVEMTEPHVAFSGVVAPDIASSDRFVWSFQVDRPYLVAAEKLAENAYRGARDIPGGALKGLLANHLGARLGGPSSELSKALSDLRIGFARPVGAAQALPLSIVFDGANERRCDLSAQSPEISQESKLARQADWKNPPYEPEYFENRVHVAIDADTGGVVEHQLFVSHARLAPRDGFKAVLDFANVDQAMRKDLIDAIFEPLVGLGRTDAILTTTALSRHADDAAKALSAGRTVLKLMSPALMVGPLNAASEEAAYRAFWREALPHSALLNWFTRETLVGGYQAMRFGLKGKYTPFVLTDASSVFVLDVAEKDLAAFEHINRFGVCLDRWAGQATHWQNCPFVTENGYGEIGIHSPLNAEDAR